jgi:hypothetical protein
MIDCEGVRFAQKMSQITGDQRVPEPYLPFMRMFGLSAKYNCTLLYFYWLSSSALL